MHIGLVSDTHDNLANVERALTQMRLEGISTLLHAGDVTDARTLRLFRGFDLWLARGNMDHDLGLQQAATAVFGAGRLLASHTIQIDGAAIALIHRGEGATGAQLTSSGMFDYVICGHTHRPQDRWVGTTRVINPGALGNQRWDTPTFAILDLATGELRWYSL